jgi:hypothetical protein
LDPHAGIGSRHERDWSAIRPVGTFELRCDFFTAYTDDSRLEVSILPAVAFHYGEARIACVGESRRDITGELDISAISLRKADL